MSSTPEFKIPTTPSPTSINATEKQLWEIIRMVPVPGLNVTYGTVRCIVYVIKKDENESISSAVDVAKGAMQTAAIAVGVLTAPVSIPIGTGVLTGVATKSVYDTVEVIIFFVTNTEQLQGKTSEEKERLFYDKIKNVTGVGALYSAARVPVYLFKKNKQQSVESTVNFMANTGGAAVIVGAGMIPNIDEQLRALIQKNATNTVNFFAKKVLEQVSRRNMPMEQGLAVIAEAESDCQALMEATSSYSLSLNSGIPAVEDSSKPSGNIGKTGHEKDKKSRAVRNIWIKCFTCGSACCSTSRKLSVKNCRSSKLVESKSEENRSQSGTLNDQPNAHLIILTE